MTSETVEPQPRWSRNRWWAMIGLVFAAQLGLIFWLGSPHRMVKIHYDLAPSLQLAGTNASAFLALSDPTLFALPHIEGFSGQAWLATTQEFLPVTSPEPAHWLTLNPERLGASFSQFASTNQAVDLPVLTQPELQLKQPVVMETEFFPTRSVVRLTGDLAARKLASVLTIPVGVASSEILTNTIIQVGVGGDGIPISVVLIGHSGSIEADQLALREARRARFEPLSSPIPTPPMNGLAWGQFVFEWYTLPLPLTNSPPGNIAPK